MEHRTSASSLAPNVAAQEVGDAAPRGAPLALVQATPATCRCWAKSHCRVAERVRVLRTERADRGVANVPDEHIGAHVGRECSDVEIGPLVDRTASHPPPRRPDSNPRPPFAEGNSSNRPPNSCLRAPKRARAGLDPAGCR